MTSIIRLQALSGVFDESPHRYILQVDDFRFLLDCGWDEKFKLASIKELKKHVHQIDAVLLSYPDYNHLGALPYAVGKLGLNCPIYATIPVYKMGQMFMYDLFQSRHNTEEFDLFTLDDVDAAFDKIIQLKYNQNVSLKGKGHGLTITPLLAGHMIGGTIWRIVKDGEEDIVYGVDYNHKKERHLNGCVLETISRPSLLITDAFNATYNQARRRQRDEQLMTNILQTLRNGGNVLVAVDTAGRVLELAHMLDQLWRNQDSGLLAYSLALLNNVSYNVVEFAKSQVEWMSDKIMRSFEGARNNPFQFKHLQLCHSLAELAKVPDPKVVLASTPDMECGFSRELFLQWCGNPKNSIILTTRTSPGTLARYLVDNPAMRTITLEVRKRVRLEGSELEEYMRKEKERELDGSKLKSDKINRRSAFKHCTKNEVFKRHVRYSENGFQLNGRSSYLPHLMKTSDHITVDSSEESEDEMEIDNVGVGKAKHDLMMKNEGKSRGGFFKQAKKSYPMFPVREEKLKWDDYGEIIRPEDFIIVEFNPAEEESKEKTEEINEEIQDISEVPTKCVKSLQTVDINCSVQFIDFEGRSDGESIKKIISLMKPRRIIIVRGIPDATDALAAYCQGGAVQGRVFTPHLYETIDATTESHIYQVRLKDSLVSSLHFSKAKDAELAWVDGEILMEEDEAMKDIKPFLDEMEEEIPIKEEEEDEFGNKKPAKSETRDVIPTLEPLPLVQVTGHSTVFVNELKLSDFKQVLMRAGIQAEFSAGVLYCNNGLLAIRRNEAGRINLEGCLCEDYYKVRDLLYEQYAII